jgi:hypothetical protein
MPSPSEGAPSAVEATSAVSVSFVIYGGFFLRQSIPVGNFARCGRTAAGVFLPDSRKALPRRQREDRRLSLAFSGRIR